MTSTTQTTPGGHHALDGLLGLLHKSFAGLDARLRRDTERAQAAATLHALSDRMLYDIGIVRDSIHKRVLADSDRGYKYRSPRQNSLSDSQKAASSRNLGPSGH